MENEHDRQILAMAQRDDVSAQDIVEATEIPTSTVYRRLSRLQEDDLLFVAAGTMRDGHPIDLYRTPLEMVALRIEEGHIDAVWRIEASPDERLYRLWTQLRGD